MARTLFKLPLLAALLGLGLPAFAQDDDDDFLDDILGEGTGDSVRDEQDAIRSGDMDDRVGVNSGDVLALEEDGGKTIIKVLERKDFLKLGRFEALPTVGFVTNDPFLNRYIVGAGLGYHITEIFAIEANFGYSPDLGDVDWKPLTHQLVEKNHVSPDISKLTLFGNGNFQFSPIYGKVAVNGRNIIRFDLFGSFGMGFTQTQDDLEALGVADDDDNTRATDTEVEIHATTNFGGGARVILSDNVAVRIDARSLVYIETVNSTTLEMKNNFILSGAVSFFFPGMDR
jgi:outer membrane beta-barrel protein